jgi:general stress protein 26
MAWSETLVDRVQGILDRSAETAGREARKSVANAAYRLTATETLDALGAWRALGVVSLATVGAAGQPHIAAVHAGFDGEDFTFRAFEGSRKHADLSRSPRVAICKTLPDTTKVSIYGKAREVPEEREADPDPLGDRSWTVKYVVEISRIHAIRPRR